jgi:hypothetical protein
MNRSIDDKQAIYKNTCPAKAGKMRSSANVHLLQFTGKQMGLSEFERCKMSILAKSKFSSPRKPQSRFDAPF